MTPLLLLVAAALVMANVRLRRVTAERIRSARVLAGPPRDPDTGMLGADALQVVVGADLALIQAERRSMSVVVCAIFSRDPEATMRRVEQVRRAHEPCIRIEDHRFAIVWHDDSGPSYVDGALQRLARTILETCQMADIGVAIAHNDDVPPLGLVNEARVAARPVQEYLPDVTSS